jgi:16S rRNA U516 pseudouridylate synthase RsuA-like enzyme
MLEAVGYPPLRLRRVSVGPLGVGRLKVGDYRQLTAAEVASLRRVGAIQHVRPGRQAESGERPERDR